MEAACASPSARLKKIVKNRPDSQKIELLDVPEKSGAEKFETRVQCDSNRIEVNISFRDVGCSVKEGFFRQKKRTLLDKINGDFYSGELTAIMGPSGSGKTTLMNILAGYTKSGVSGQIYTNNKLRDDTSFRRRSCYIMQDDRLQPLLTVQEAMTIAANLKLPYSLSAKEKQSKVQEILESMNLWIYRKSKTQSLSGGQKKRLSLALEMVENPQVMFFDEPTSGLDSLSSKQCVMLLKDIAATGRTIICTIHQPSAMIFDLFDHLYVVANGKCMYQGSVKGLVPYLEEVGLRCPTYHNPADYLLEVVSGEHGDHYEALEVKSDNGLNSDWRRRQPSSIKLDSTNYFGNIMESELNPPVHAKTHFPRSKAKNCDKNQRLYPTTFPYQIYVLVKRTFLTLSRDKTLMYNRLATHSCIALFIGILYYGIGTDASNMLNNFNYMFFSVMFLMLTAFNCVTTTFPSELPIVTREHFNKWYSLKSYYLAITFADVPIQVLATLIYGCITYFLTQQPVEPYRIILFLFMCVLISLVAQSFGLFIGASMDVKNGVIFGPFCFLPFTIFSGFFVQLTNCHPYMRWLFHISFLKYGFEGLVLSILGYDRPKLPCNADYCHFVNPQKFIATMDMNEANYWYSVIFLVGLIVFIRIGAYFALKNQMRRSRCKRS